MVRSTITTMPKNDWLQLQHKQTLARYRYPAPMPYSRCKMLTQRLDWKKIPPRPILRVNKNSTGISVSWDMEQIEDYAKVTHYKIYAYQETSNSPPTDTWKHVDDVEAMNLPMITTYRITQLQNGQKYHFAVRAVDEHGRSGLLSIPKTYL